MKKMSTKRQLLIALTVGVVGSVVWSVYSFSPGGPLYQGARWIPKDRPDERNRVFHPKGFSIIPPPGWKVSSSEDGMGSTPGAGRNVRYTPRLTVRTTDRRWRWPGKTMAENQRETVLAGQVAHEALDPLVGGGDEPYFTYAAWVERDGIWYEILYQTPNGSWSSPQYTSTPEGVAQYIQSFRLTELSTAKGPEAPPLSTQPASQAATSSGFRAP